MSKRDPRELVDEIERMSEADRMLFFEQIGAMCNTFNYTRTKIVETMFPSRSNSKHGAHLEHCRKFVRDHGYLTRVHAFATMSASTFRRCILKPLLEEGVITDSGERWKKDGQGQPHKVFRDNTRRYQRLLGVREAPKPVISMSIVNEPLATAKKFVSQVLTKEQVLKVGFPKVPGFIATLSNIGYADANQDTLVEWCKVVEGEIRDQVSTYPSLAVYKVFNGKITVKTDTGRVGE
jgi:hypothetical protein